MASLIITNKGISLVTSMFLNFETLLFPGIANHLCHNISIKQTEKTISSYLSFQRKLTKSLFYSASFLAMALKTLFVIVGLCKVTVQDPGVAGAVSFEALRRNAKHSFPAPTELLSMRDMVC